MAIITNHFVVGCCIQAKTIHDNKHQAELSIILESSIYDEVVLSARGGMAEGVLSGGGFVRAPSITSAVSGMSRPLCDVTAWAGKEAVGHVDGDWVVDYFVKRSDATNFNALIIINTQLHPLNDSILLHFHLQWPKVTTCVIISNRFRC